MDVKLIVLKGILRWKRFLVKKRVYLLGEKIKIKRESSPSVEVYLYYPEGKQKVQLPIIFNVHGGAWIAGDATGLDHQAQRLANTLGVAVVNINYHKIDEKPFPYPQYEIRDVVKHFEKNHMEYGVDTSHFILMGYSAGGHLCACVEQLLHEEGHPIAGQILCYPFLDFTFGLKEKIEIKKKCESLGMVEEVFFANLSQEEPLCSPGNQCIEKLKGAAPTMLITCGEDPLKIQAERYHERLLEANVQVQLNYYPESRHGFLEVDFEDSKKKPQEVLALKEVQSKCEADICEWISNLMNK